MSKIEFTNALLSWLQEVADPDVAEALVVAALERTHGEYEAALAMAERAYAEGASL